MSARRPPESPTNLRPADVFQPPHSPKAQNFAPPAAAKFLLVDFDGEHRALKRFPSLAAPLAEIDCCCRLSHPGIAKAELLGPQKCDKLQQLALLFPLPGYRLRDVIQSPHFGYQSRLRVLRQLAEALAYLHCQGVLHCGLCLASVVLSGPIDEPQACFFGLESAAVGCNPRDSASVTASPDHWSPEALRGSWGAPSDVWALGVIFYYTLSRYGLYDCFPEDSPSHLGEAPRQAMLHFQEKWFSDACRSAALDHLLRQAPRDIRKKMAPLLEQMLDPIPERRLTAPQVAAWPGWAAVCQTQVPPPVFFGVRREPAVPKLKKSAELEAPGSVLPSSLEPEIFTELAKMQINWLFSAFLQEKMEALFLAVDLLFRCLPFMPENSERQLVNAAACVGIAIRVVSRPTQAALAELNQKLAAAAAEGAEDFLGEGNPSNFSADSLGAAEAGIVQRLNGVLYLHSWYRACRNRYQLGVVYEEVIRKPTVEVYGGSPAKFLAGITEPAETAANKDVTIGQFFE